MHWPQITYLVMLCLGMGISIERNGKPKTGFYSANVDFISVCIALFLLYCGGFFNQ